MNLAAVVLAALMAAAGGPQMPPAEPASRADALARIRDQKARTLEPYEPGKLEKLLLKVERDRMIEDFLETGSGFYIRSGNLRTGSGLAFGPGYKRRDLRDGNVAIDVSAAASLRKYWGVNGALTFPRLWNSRGAAQFHGRHFEFPQEDFYGLGPDSSRDDQVSFLYRDTAFGATLGANVRPFLLVSGTAEWVAPAVGRGRDSSVPTLDEIFAPEQAPGYTERATYMRYELRADLNYAQPFGNPRDGGRYIVSYNHYDDIDSGSFGFNRLDVDLRQYISFLKSRRVFALRGYLSTTRPNGGDTVPFYMMGTLGGHNTLRGFRNYRFRDTNLVLMQVEYRWEIFPALDAALFYDTGKVAPSWRGLTLDDLEHDYGIGFRFGTNAGVFMRIDLSFGSSEGGRLFWRWGNVF